MTADTEDVNPALRKRLKTGAVARLAKLAEHVLGSNPAAGCACGA